jgi:hypothetical protein
MRDVNPRHQLVFQGIPTGRFVFERCCQGMAKAIPIHMDIRGAYKMLIPKK